MKIMGDLQKSGVKFTRNINAVGLFNLYQKVQPTAGIQSRTEKKS